MRGYMQTMQQERFSNFVTATLLVMAVFCLAAVSVAQPSKGEKLAPYFPTPHSVVERMLQMADVKSTDTVFDLGSGDGRIVIAAAEKFGATAVGVEFDDSLVTQSRMAIKRRGLEKKASIIAGDMMVQDYTSASVVTLYLLPTSNEKMLPILQRQLKAGTRLVCHDFDFPQLTPEQTITIEDDGEGRSHTLFLYVLK